MLLENDGLFRLGKSVAGISLCGKDRSTVLSFLVFCILVFPAVSSAASVTDSDWAQGILEKTLNDNGILKIDYNFGTGKDGSFTGDFGSKAPAWRVAGPSYITLGTSSVTLYSSPSGLSAGDEVLLINLQGTQPDTAFVGKYEFLEVSSISGSIVTFKTPTINAYGYSSEQAIFLQRVPHYTTTIVSQMTSLPWNLTLSKTGIIAFRVNNYLSIDGSISANGLGYGGGYAKTQGESISGKGTQIKTANIGGGGGGQTNLECGAGGGYFTKGDNCVSYTYTITGGDAYFSGDKINLGSGGGGGGDFFTSTGGNGGRGGGIVLIYARSISGSGSIQAKGENGYPGTGYLSQYGGGGSGGIVVVKVMPQNQAFPSSQINVSGGSGTGGTAADKGGGGEGYYLSGTNEERFLDGTFRSKVFDSGFPEGANWTNMTVSLSQQIPSGSQVKAYYHACLTSDCSGQTAWTECGTLTSGSVLRCDTKPNTNIGRFFQYRLDLARSTIDMYATPSVSSAKIEYTSSDIAAPIVTVTGAPVGWVNTDMQASIACTDFGTGCDEMSYRLMTYTSSPPSVCPKDYSQYTQQPPLTISTQTWVCGAAKDKAGTAGYTQIPANFSIDKGLPTADIRNESTTWVRSNNLTLICSDTLSGCQQTIYYIFVPSPGSDCQSGGTPTTSRFIIVSSDHNDYLCIRVSDNAGNRVMAMSSQLMVDASNPVTVDDVRSGVSDWYGSPARIKLICSDSVSGCSRTYYCIDNEGGACVPSTQSTTTETLVDVTCSSGQQTCSKIIRYYSEDVAGNKEATKSSGVIKIDTTLPVCTITSPTNPYTTTSQITVSWEATSPGSPILNVVVEKMEDLGGWIQLVSSQNPTGSQTISNPLNGVTYSFRCKATNQMGVESSYSSVTATTVDTAPPTASIVASPVVNTTTFVVSWYGNDMESGISNYTLFYRTGSGTYSQWNVYQTYTTSDVFGQGGVPVIPQNGNIYTLKVRVMDKAGNTKESGEVSVLVDTAKPSCIIQDMPAYQASGDFTVKWSGVDGESGIKEYIVEQRSGISWIEFYRGPATSKDIVNAQDGIYRFRCSAIDNANNMGDVSAEKNTTVDLNPPQADINFSTSVYVNEELLINAKVTDAIKVSSVILYYNDNFVPETVSTPNSNYSTWDLTWIISGLVSTGMKTFIIQAEDASGNSWNYTNQFLVAYCIPGEIVQGCECGTGEKTCLSNGTWSDCMGATKHPTLEVCNGLDDDCNNIVDDVNSGNTIQSAQCQCFGTSLLAAQSETCDGIDNDCDGQIDEGGGCCDEGDTQPCGSDVGICKNRRKTCSNQIWGPCTWELGPNPGGEICGNGLDDDCNGVVDDGCVPCTDRDGDGYGDPASNLCAYSGQDCDDYDPSANPGMQEVCDSMDNDCDGQADEGLSDCGACNNGIQDTYEEGVDCGGDCPPCFVWGWLFLTAGGILILLILAFVWLHFKRQGRELTWEELKKKWTPPE